METFEQLKNRLRKESIEDMKKDGITFEQADTAFIDMMENDNSEKRLFDIVYKIGTSSSGNFGHAGRPGQVGGSASFGVGIYDRDDRDIDDIEVNQQALFDDIYLRELNYKDFIPGGKYAYVMRKWNREDEEGDEPDMAYMSDNQKLKYIKETIERINDDSELGIASELTGMANKQNVSNSIYDKLKKDAEFIEYVKGKNLSYNSAIEDGSTTAKTEKEYWERRSKAAISDHIKLWSATSADNSPKSIAVQIIAQKLFGEKANTDHLLKDKDNTFKNKVDDEIEHNSSFIKKVLQAQYDLTQEYLKKADVSELVVYRGHEGKRNALKSSKSTEVNMQPLSSFSLTFMVADNFTSSEEAEQYKRRKPSIIASIIPVKKVFALPNTGIGCTSEFEVIVLGGKIKSTVIGHDILKTIIDPDIDSASGVKEAISKSKVLKSIKSIKKEVINLDEDLINADWTKQTWDVDIPKYGSKEFNQYLKDINMTLEDFQKLPLYYLNYGSNKKEKSLFNIIFKGGAGSGSWSGQAQPRFAWSPKERLSALLKEREKRGSSGSTQSNKVDISKYPKDAKQITSEQAMAQADYNEIKSQMEKNLSEVKKDKVKLIEVKGELNDKSASDIEKNMKSELASYSNYLAGDTNNAARDYIDAFRETINKGVKDGSLKDIKAEDLNQLAIDNMQKLIHQEVESNRQQFTDHGIRHITGDIARQRAIMNEMNPKTTGKEELMGDMILINHDVGYSTPLIREGGERGIVMSKQHQLFSEKIAQQQKSLWNEDKIFTSDEYDKILNAIKTHDSTKMDKKDALTTSVRLSDNLSLFSKEKLPGVFKYISGGDTYLMNMGIAARKKDTAAFEKHRSDLYKKIDRANISSQLKRDLKAATSKISYLTPKFSMGVLAGEISSIKKDNKSGRVNINIQYNDYDAKMQKLFDMGQKQTKKFLEDYGIKDYSKTEYDVGDILRLKVDGYVGGKRITSLADIIYKGGQGSGNYGHSGRPGMIGGSGLEGNILLTSKPSGFENDKNIISRSGTTINYQGEFLKKERSLAKKIEKEVRTWEGDRGDIGGSAVKEMSFPDEDSIGIITKDKGEIVGVLNYEFDSKRLYVHEIATKRPGYGAEIMKEVIKIAVENKKGIELFATKEAADFYRGIGIKPIGRVPKERAGKFGLNYIDAKGWLTVHKSIYDIPEPESGCFADSRKFRRKDRFKEITFVEMMFERILLNDNKEEKNFKEITLLEMLTKGGPGSGNFGHSGRPGMIGGSGSGGGTGSLNERRNTSGTRAGNPGKYGIGIWKPVKVVITKEKVKTKKGVPVIDPTTGKQKIKNNYSYFQANGKPLPKYMDGWAWKANMKDPLWLEVKKPEDLKRLKEVKFLVQGRIEGVEKDKWQMGIYKNPLTGKKLEKTEKDYAKATILDSVYDKVYSMNERNRTSKDFSIRENADLTRLIMASGIRVGGNEEENAAMRSAASKKIGQEVYGASSLLGKHVAVDKGTVYLRFPAKSGVLYDYEVTDKTVAKMMTDRAKKAGKDGTLFDQESVGKNKIAAYTRTLDENEFTPKTFRTLVGTRIAQKAISDMRTPKTPEDYKAAVEEVGLRVGTVLGHRSKVPVYKTKWDKKAGKTVFVKKKDRKTGRMKRVKTGKFNLEVRSATALASYINPALFQEWHMASH